MLVREEYICIEEGPDGEEKSYRIGGLEPYEPFTDDTGKLFRSLQREFGRCVSKVYIDRKDGETIPIGWVFQKRRKYDGSNDTYIQESWITLYDKYEERTVVEAEYHSLNGKDQ